MTTSGMFNSNGTGGGEMAPLPLPVDEDGGIDLRQIRPGTVLEVQTRNTTYTIIPQRSGETLISGHAEFCPLPTLTTGLGSAYVNGLFREHYLSPGMHLSFPSEGRRVNTSRIIGIQSVGHRAN